MSPDSLSLSHSHQVIEEMTATVNTKTSHTEIQIHSRAAMAAIDLYRLVVAVLTFLAPYRGEPLDGPNGAHSKPRQALAVFALGTRGLHPTAVERYTSQPMHQ